MFILIFKVSALGTAYIPNTLVSILPEGTSKISIQSALNKALPLTALLQWWQFKLQLMCFYYFVLYSSLCILVIIYSYSESPHARVRCIYYRFVIY